MKVAFRLWGHGVGQIVAIPIALIAFALLSDLSHGALIAAAAVYVVLLGFIGARAFGHNKAKRGLKNETVNG